MDSPKPQPPDVEAHDDEVTELFETLYFDYAETLTPDEFSACLDGLFLLVGDAPAFEMVTVTDEGKKHALMMLREDLIEPLVLAVQGRINKKAEVS